MKSNVPCLTTYKIKVLERSCIFVRGIDLASIYNLLLHFLTVLTVWYFFSIFIFQGSDQTMLAKLHQQHGSNKNYIKPKAEISVMFGLNHFAGLVLYDSRGKYMSNLGLWPLTYTWHRLLVTCGRSVVFSGYSGFLHQYNWPHDITEILLTVALNTNTLTPYTWHRCHVWTLLTLLDSCSYNHRGQVKPD